ncbi:MAG: polyphosphate kinase 1 [Candidatus Methanomethylophilaceae archaeon]|jgi:polyphosphate kinase|nr:polyphosphate kinase 1 [Candidatus Methanomethylophilaceae archaeon]NLF33878.1 polyphosphate kinase 1 [Thermoplasmatales archaeon]
MDTPDLYDRSLYINRELSWLEFNRRCLAEANDPENRLLERVKFLAICHGNMDEFFMIRVPGLILRRSPGMMLDAPDNMDPDTLIRTLSSEVQVLVREYSECWKELKRLLYREGVRIRTVESLSSEQRAWVSNFYRTRVHPVLTPLALDVSHPFPFISNNSLNLAVRLDRKGETLHARVKIPVGTFPRFVRIPSEQGGSDFVLLEDIVRHSAHMLFPGLTVEGAYPFRVTRNADIKVTIDEACDLMSAVEESIEGRDTGFAVRMMVDDEMPRDMVSMFGNNLKLTKMQIHKSGGAMMLTDLWEIANLDIPSLREEPLTPFTPPELSEEASLFPAIKERDWILYHPYESFSTIVRLINEAASDPGVQSIKICLYRVGRDPPVVQALRKARERGKTVSVLMELRAKFDESNNILWARELERIGVHVVYGPVDLKVHSKMLQIVRLEGDKLVRYTHLSSGNYNVGTARQYGDISFLTANQEIGEDVGELFNTLTGYFGPRVYNHILVAPVTLKGRLIEMIDREIRHMCASGDGYIAFKANGLIDSDIIAALYRASMAGVKVDLNIRGLCCLRPGVPGISDNIRVISIVDRFLEHARIYYFNNGGDPEMYMGSSDMMPRNLVARVEVIFPVLDREMMRQVKESILDVHLADNVKARNLLSDGRYVPVERRGPPLRSQQWLLENRGIWHG